MFEHLDDPDPPRPSRLVVDRIAAEGGRRLRRRRIAAGGAAVVLAAVGVVGVAGQLPGQESAKVDTIGPAGDTKETTTSVDDTSTTSTTTAPGTTTTAPLADGGGVEPTPADDAGEGGEVFAAVVRAEGRDAAEVVLADAVTGEVDRVLAEFPLLDRPQTCCVEWSERDGIVYYVVPAGDYGSGMLPDTIWQVPTGGGSARQVVAGSNPALSPDGTRLAYTTPIAGDAPPEVVVRRLGSGSGDIRLPAEFVDDHIYSVGFADDDTLVYATGGPEAPPAVATLSLSGSPTSLADGEPLGPASGAPAGTGWNWPEWRSADDHVGVVESCCALDAGTYQGETAYLVVDPLSGTVQDRVVLPGPVVAAEASPSGRPELFLQPPPDYPGPTTLVRRTDGGELEEIGGGREFIAVDW